MSPLHKYVYINGIMLKRGLHTEGIFFFNVNDALLINGTYFEYLSLFL